MTTHAQGGARRDSVMAWRDEYAVGVEEVDSQHQRLFELIAAFYEGLERKQARRALGELLVGLVDYTRYHFQTEEELMARSGYPAVRAHEQAHVAFIEKVSDMAERFQGDRLVLSIEATSFIREWLTSHILVTDKKLGSWLQSLRADKPAPIATAPAATRDPSPRNRA